MQNTIILSTFRLSGQARIGIKFPYNAILISVAKNVPGYLFSRTLRQFHYPHSPEILQKLIETFKPLAKIKTEGDFTTSFQKVVWEQTLPSPEAQEKMQQYKKWLRSKRYSENTISTYMDALKAFLKFYNSKALAEITNDDIIKYNNDFILKHELSASYQNQVVNSIKLFFKIVENKSIDTEKIHRPKKPKLLPNVLSKEEIKLILKAHGNIKHRAMLSLIYSCGLRRSELLNLKLTDVDSKRNLLIVRQSSHKKRKKITQTSTSP